MNPWEIESCRRDQELACQELSPEPRSLWCQILCALRAGDPLPQLPQPFAGCVPRLPCCCTPLLLSPPPLGDALVAFSDVRIGHRSMEKEVIGPRPQQVWDRARPEALSLQLGPEDIWRVGTALLRRPPSLRLQGWDRVRALTWWDRAASPLPTRGLSPRSFLSPAQIRPFLASGSGRPWCPGRIRRSTAQRSAERAPSDHWREGLCLLVRRQANDLLSAPGVSRHSPGVPPPDVRRGAALREVPVSVSVPHPCAC